MTKFNLDTSPVVLKAADFKSLLDALHAQGWETIGPRIRDGAVVFESIQNATELPVGWGDEQSEGKYRLHQSSDGRLFGYNVGPMSAKPFLHASRAELWRGQSDLKQATSPTKIMRKTALVGIRPCDLQAIFKQDDILLRGTFQDALYAARRRNLFLIVVECTRAGGTCFCKSTGTGPQATAEFDLALTEIKHDGGHWFLLRAGSRSGSELLKQLIVQEATPEQIQQARGMTEDAAQQMGRELETEDLRDILVRETENPRWEQIATRCLGCGNCTSVCPTCFCITTEDSVSLDGFTATREQRWDSCFTLDHSYMHGGSVRQSAKSRYRQWVMHKFATWHDQFGTSGCVGCGRCITWCPAGIDITAEIAAIRTPANQEEALDENN